MAYHARMLTEYATFKAVRSGSIYRAACDPDKQMLKAALLALAPTIPPQTKLASSLSEAFQANAQKALTNTGSKGQPLIWLDYWLENTDHDFDEQLDPSATNVERLHVKIVYFYEYRIPFANWIMTRYWLAVNNGLHWAAGDPTIEASKARQPTVSPAVDAAIIGQVQANLGLKAYTLPIVTTWSMRMFSDPVQKAKAATDPKSPLRCK
jgi:hypothetical protein